jgi:hypothetical protein
MKSSTSLDSKLPSNTKAGGVAADGWHGGYLPFTFTDTDENGNIPKDKNGNTPKYGQEFNTRSSNAAGQRPLHSPCPS